MYSGQIYCVNPVSGFQLFYFNRSAVQSEITAYFGGGIDV